MAQTMISDEQVLKDNIGLIYSILTRYFRPFINSYKDDLIQEGSLGLLGAWKRFDPDRELKFSTYAYWWIFGYMQKFLSKIPAVRVPEYKFYKMSKEEQIRRSDLISLDDEYCKSLKVDSDSDENFTYKDIIAFNLDGDNFNRAINNNLFFESLSKILSPDELECIFDYYIANKSLRKVGKDFKVSGEAIRLRLLKIKAKIIRAGLN